MEGILSNLNLDTTAFIWHSVNFLVLVAAMWWWFFRPLSRVIELRQQRIQASLARAEEIDRLDHLAEVKRQELITEAYKDAAETRRRADEQVRRFVVRSRGQANAEADRIRARAAARHTAASTPRHASVRRKAVARAGVSGSEIEVR